MFSLCTSLFFSVVASYSFIISFLLLISTFYICIHIFIVVGLFYVIKNMFNRPIKNGMPRFHWNAGSLYSIHSVICYLFSPSKYTCSMFFHIKNIVMLRNSALFLWLLTTDDNCFSCHYYYCFCKIKKIERKMCIWTGIYIHDNELQRFIFENHPKIVLNEWKPQNRFILGNFK